MRSNRARHPDQPTAAPQPAGGQRHTKREVAKAVILALTRDEVLEKCAEYRAEQARLAARGGQARPAAPATDVASRSTGRRCAGGGGASIPTAASAGAALRRSACTGKGES